MKRFFDTALAAWLWFVREFLRLTWLRALFIAGLFGLCSLFINAKSDQYYAGLTMPPSFRHVGDLDRDRVFFNYLKAHKVDENTVLVFGDCVTFGHGVKKLFTEFMDIDGHRIVNLSMQSMNYSLASMLIEAAYERGVRKVIIQLHPFENYPAEQSSWMSLSKSFPQAGYQEYGNNIAYGPQSRVNRRWLISGYMKGVREIGLFEKTRPWRHLSANLKYDILGNWCLFANRFAFDDWSSIDKSKFAHRTNRIDSYKIPLTKEYQQSIIKKKSAFWKYFIIEDEEEFIKKAAFDLRQNG